MKPDSPGGQRIFIKHYSAPRFSKQLKHLVRNSRTRQEWEMGLALEEMGLPVPRHLAMAERKRFGLLQEDYLFQEALEGYENFDKWFSKNYEHARSGPAVRERRDVIRLLAGLIRKMHDLGVLQRDFKPDSVMAGPEGDFKLVDLERVLIRRGRGGLNVRKRLDNLANIDYTFAFTGGVADRLRFLHHYFRDDDISPDEIRTYALHISRLAEKKFRKRCRDRKSWVKSTNEVYKVYTLRGHRVCALRSVPDGFIRSVVARLDRIEAEELAYPTEKGQPDRKLLAVWCDARKAMEKNPALSYRRVPFIPARVAITPLSGSRGLLLYIDPGEDFIPWDRAAKEAMENGVELDFAVDLGRTLRILHRMGITCKEWLPDALLYHTKAGGWARRLVLNRLDNLVLGRSPSEKQSEKILTKTAGYLDLTPEVQHQMKSSYSRCMMRWFPRPVSV